ncbi:hypothetical protein LSTR_LSTR006401 [Laodelphax striatellus]|uniref:NEK6-subfamily protein kinase n=1 Tax=Laodelphax striatellus TaxID=195883 RepID=A0A482WXH5_LAOST|nr:hypothetical protein LSTR_LSTR006401 [Laodelphax striatellus]
MSEKELLALTSANQNARYSSLDNFIIEERIGRGSFSVIYKARCRQDNSVVAMKEVQILDMVDSTARIDCMKEISLLQKLDHPNIIRYISSVIENNKLYIFLELADSGDLSRMIRNFRKIRKLIPERTIWKYFVQICDGLEHMHSKSIMHRDLKPANVLVTTGGVIKLGDLNLSRFFSPKTNAAQSIVGTPYYMSPERIHEKPYTFSSDIWSLGCLLYELAALHSPFFEERQNIYMLCRRIDKCLYAPIPSEIYSQEIGDLVSKCITANPSQRPDIVAVHKVAKEMNRLFLENKTPNQAK